MDDLIRLIISEKRLENNQNNIIKLSNDEAHYVNKVMRIKLAQEIFITDGQGKLWKAQKIKNNLIEIFNPDKPFLFQEREKILLGIAVVIPRNGFEDILKMCTEIGIDLIQPLSSDRQVKKISNFSRKSLRWDSIINEAVEQCERLWKPSLFNCIDIFDWLDSQKNNDYISISVTRNNSYPTLNQWLNNSEFSSDKKGAIFWNVIGPEGGWSQKELENFQKNKIQFVRLSDSILRTSTATINATSILNKWRNEDFKFENIS